MREHGQSATTVRAVPPANVAEVLVLAVGGELDAASAISLPTQLLDAVRPGHDAVVLDMAGVNFASAAGARALTDFAAMLAELGRTLVLASCRPAVHEVIRHAGALTTVRHHPSVKAALAAQHAVHVDEPDLGEGLELLRQRARNLPRPLRTRPLVAGAISELHERYRLPDPDTAFALLRETSQRYNLRLRSLALAFLSAPPARPDRPLWFGGRRRDAPPSTTFTAPSREWPSSRGNFLTAVLDAALSTMASEAGYLQVIDRFVGGLQLESQRGLPGDVRRFLANADRAEQPCDPKLPTIREVTVDFDVACSAALHARGLRWAYSVPLVARDRPIMGVVSTLHGDAAGIPTTDQATALDMLSTESASWLDWYRRTVLLDALEHLHYTARQARLHH